MGIKELINGPAQQFRERQPPFFGKGLEVCKLLETEHNRYAFHI